MGTKFAFEANQMNNVVQDTFLVGMFGGAGT
jgi:hypothetical protein